MLILMCFCSTVNYNFIYTFINVFNKIYSINYVLGILLSIKKTTLNKIPMFYVLLEFKFINTLVSEEFSQQ